MGTQNNGMDKPYQDHTIKETTRFVKRKPAKEKGSFAGFASMCYQETRKVQRLLPPFTLPSIVTLIVLPNTCVNMAST